jgi:hypothetical protein
MFLESFHQWFFQKHCHTPFCGYRMVDNKKKFIVARSTTKTYFRSPFVTKVAQLLIKILMRQLQNDCIMSILTTMFGTIGKPLMCRGPLRHGFIMFKFVVQKLFNILKIQIENSIK